MTSLEQALQPLADVLKALSRVLEDVLRAIDVKLLDIDQKTGKFKLSHQVLIPKPEKKG